MKMEKKLRELQQHVVAAQNCLKDLLSQESDEEVDDGADEGGDIGGKGDDDEDFAGSSLKMKLSKYK